MFAGTGIDQAGPAFHGMPSLAGGGNSNGLASFAGLESEMSLGQELEMMLAGSVE